MFYGCDSLNYLDISNLILINVFYSKNMFSNISNLKYINIYNTSDYYHVLSDYFNFVRLSEKSKLQPA